MVLRTWMISYGVYMYVVADLRLLLLCTLQTQLWATANGVSAMSTPGAVCKMQVIRKTMMAGLDVLDGGAPATMKRSSRINTTRELDDEVADVEVH
jgi:hypothetical protein